MGEILFGLLEKYHNKIFHAGSMPFFTKKLKKITVKRSNGNRHIKPLLYKPVDFFQNGEVIDEYLNDAFMDDDPQMFVIALGHVVKAKAISQLENRTGLNR